MNLKTVEFELAGVTLILNVFMFMSTPKDANSVDDVKTVPYCDTDPVVPLCTIDNSVNSYSPDVASEIETSYFALL